MKIFDQWSQKLKLFGKDLISFTKASTHIITKSLVNIYSLDFLQDKINQHWADRITMNIKYWQVYVMIREQCSCVHFLVSRMLFGGPSLSLSPLFFLFFFCFSRLSLSLSLIHEKEEESSEMGQPALPKVTSNLSFSSAFSFFFLNYVQIPNTLKDRHLKNPKYQLIINLP